MGAGLFSLALRSVSNRATAATLTIVAVALSTALFLGVDKVRTGVRAGFERSVSGTDLIVGARSGPINLLLYSVFRIGDATANISWEAYEAVADRPDVAWAIPISLGDSHRGFRVVGAPADFFDDRFRDGPALVDGHFYEDLFDAVLGADVADALGYTLGDELELTHGLGEAGLSDHEHRHFHVAGMLQRTGTPADRSIYISLEAMTAIHVGWESGARNPLADSITNEQLRTFDLTPRDVTAVFIGLADRTTILRTKRDIDTDANEPLLAIIPGQALRQLWQVTGVAERALLAVSLFVIAIGLVSIITVILTSMNERRREMAILRATGARPWMVGALFMIEAGALALAGAVAGGLLANIGFALLQPWLIDRYGLALGAVGPGLTELFTIAGVTAAALVASLLPAILGYRRSLSDGLSIRL